MITVLKSDPEGRIRVNPFFLWGLLTYMIGVALAAGGALAQLSAARRDIDRLTMYMTSNVRTRAEGDEIIKRLDLRIDVLQVQLDGVKKNGRAS